MTKRFVPGDAQKEVELADWAAVTVVWEIKTRSDKTNK